MSNLSNSSISLWMAKNINKINSRKDLFDFVCKSHFPQLSLVRTLSKLSFLFLWNIEKILTLVRESMLNLPNSSISLWKTKYINKINNRKISLILSTTQHSQDLAEPLFFVPMNYKPKKKKNVNIRYRINEQLTQLLY